LITQSPRRFFQSPDGLMGVMDELLASMCEEFVVDMELFELVI